MLGKNSISIWFFIGSLLTAYGILILGSGVYGLATHRASLVVLPQLHVDLWWGAGLLVLGLFYVIHFWPD